MQIISRTNTIDNWIAQQILDNNEYRIGDMSTYDLVIDVGAHIGLFSIAAYNNGARNIIAIEPSLDNYNILRQNVDSLGIKHMQCAVWRSDMLYNPNVILFNNPDEFNTGAGNTFFPNNNHNFLYVKPISLDDLIGDYKNVFIKIDCESSEWPILFTSKKLDCVSAIVGEFHEVHGMYDPYDIPEAAKIEGIDMFTIDTLKKYLEQKGFTVTTERFVTDLETLSPSNMGHFYAYRNVKKVWW